MFLEFLSHLLALDFGWIISLILNNIVLFFMMFTLMYIFMGGKKVLLGFIILMFNIWLWLDMENISGMVWTAASFVFLYYLVKFAVLSIGESTPSLKGKLYLINEISGIAALVIFVAFFR